MTSTPTHSRREQPRTIERRHGGSSDRHRGRTAAAGPARRRATCRRRRRVLGGYHDWRGRSRELIARPGAQHSILVLDRDAATHGDSRLIAHLAPDEPISNADLVVRCFLDQAARGRCRCRALTHDDLRTVPFTDEPADCHGASDGLEQAGAAGAWPADRNGRRYSIAPFDSGMSIPELRWCCDGDVSPPERCEPLSVRDTIAALESYEPVRTLTASAIRRHRIDGVASVALLRAELVRVNESPIVLNRSLREAVLATTARDAISMSEIAMRCGRIKRDAAGNESGETSWLARRVGLLPEGGHDTPTRWIHTDVLALIARDGLGVSPREVEVQ
jgi:hypothetical protein